MEDYNNIIEGILYLKGDEGIDIKELSLILEISKKEAVEAMDHFIEAYSKRGFDGLQVVDFGGKYKLATNPQYFPYYQKIVEQSKTTLSVSTISPNSGSSSKEASEKASMNSFVTPYKIGSPGLSSLPTSLISALAMSFLIMPSQPTPLISSTLARVIG